MSTDLIVKLHDELQSHAEGYVRRSENILGDIAALNDPNCIRQLLPFFDDNEQYDELMFSVIHTIESFDDVTYVKEVTENMSSFFVNSPRWPTIVQMRILNSQPTLAAFTSQIGLLGVNERAAVRKPLEAVRAKSPQFDTCCSSLLAALSES